MTRKIALLCGAMLALFYALPLHAEVPATDSMAPDFILPDQNGVPRRLADWRGKWVVLYFYPKDDTPGCTTEACRFRDDLVQLKELGAQVVGVSVDDSASHKAFAEKYHLPFPLLADTRAEVAQKYGALADWLVVKVAKRYTFLIDPAGKIARVYLSVEASRHSAQIIADLRELRITPR
ncbi:MAG: peroxiredoxin [Rhodocyclaceae bacterium]|nr:peroxiredoxin [Rhodocyclaceae bacterium]